MNLHVKTAYISLQVPDFMIKCVRKHEVRWKAPFGGRNQLFVLRNGSKSNQPTQTSGGRGKKHKESITNIPKSPKAIIQHGGYNCGGKSNSERRNINKTTENREQRTAERNQTRDECKKIENENDGIIEADHRTVRQTQDHRAAGQ